MLTFLVRSIQSAPRCSVLPRPLAWGAQLLAAAEGWLWDPPIHHNLTPPPHPTATTLFMENPSAEMRSVTPPSGNIQPGGEAWLIKVTSVVKWEPDLPPAAPVTPPTARAQRRPVNPAARKRVLFSVKTEQLFYQRHMKPSY